MPVSDFLYDLPVRNFRVLVLVGVPKFETWQKIDNEKYAAAKSVSDT
jgi:hypothetical protein